MSDQDPSAVTAASIKCGQCQQPMTVAEFFADGHPCMTEPDMTVAEATDAT